MTESEVRGYVRAVLCDAVQKAAARALLPGVYFSMWRFDV